MQKNDNHTILPIYYRPLRKWIEVTLEEKQNGEHFIGATRQAKQRAGAYCIVCDGLPFQVDQGVLDAIYGEREAGEASV